MQSIVASPHVVAELLARLVVHIHRSSATDLFRVIGELGLSFTQVKAIHVLRQSGDANVKDVAGRLGMSLPAMSRALDGLVQRGFVERQGSEQDRRAKIVRLLPAGRDALDTIERTRVSLIEEFTATLSDEERDRLHATLLPIVERIPTP